jgi:hypothetical protein
MTKLFFRFRHRFLCCIEPDLRMCAVAKRFLGGSAATAKRHSFFGREFVSVRVDQFHFARNDVRTMLDCFDFYHNAHNLTRSAARNQSVQRNAFDAPGSISLGKASFLNSGERTLLASWSPHSAATNFCFQPKRDANYSNGCKVRDSRKLSESPTRQRRALPRTLLAPVGVKRKLGRL